MLGNGPQNPRRELPDHGGRQTTVVPRRAGDCAGSRRIPEGASSPERDRRPRPEERRANRHRMEERQGLQRGTDCSGRSGFSAQLTPRLRLPSATTGSSQNRPRPAAVHRTSSTSRSMKSAMTSMETPIRRPCSRSSSFKADQGLVAAISVNVSRIVAFRITLSLPQEERNDSPTRRLS
jgi:hypothetical protein